mgnify:CR=1 FL=1
MSKPQNPSEKHAKTFWQKRYLEWRAIWTSIVVLTLMSLSTLVILLVQLLTLFQARRFCMDVVARSFARLILWLIGIRVYKVGFTEFPKEPCVYISNHSSTIDFFAITALGIPQNRAFLTKRLRVFPPIWLMVLLLGHFFIDVQKYPKKRAACFQRAEAILRETGDNVFLTPEGTRVIGGEVGHFNKGAFHLATALKRPIVPLYLKVPEVIDPGKGFKSKTGHIEIYMHPPIETSNWTLEELLENKEGVRQLYKDFPEGEWLQKAG